MLVEGYVEWIVGYVVNVVVGEKNDLWKTVSGYWCGN
jgi:hypothetical protein